MVHLIKILPALLLVATTACSKPIAPETDKPAAGPRFNVTQVVAYDGNRNVELAASIESYESAYLMPRIEGYVKNVMVDIGDRVTKGEVLAILDVPELDVVVLQKSELIKQSRANIDLREAEVLHASEDIKSLEATLDTQMAQRDRYARLVKRGSLNQRRLDEAEYAVQTAEADLQQGKAKKKAAIALVAAAKAQRDVAKANLKLAETQAGFRKIKAPFDGLLAERTVDPGAYVRPAASDNATSMFQVVRDDMLRVVIFVPLALANYVSDDDTISLYDLPALPGKRIDMIAGKPLKISRFSDAFDADSRLMRVEIDIDNRQLHDDLGFELKPGDFGRVNLRLQPLVGKPVVPKSAVGENNQHETFVVRVGENRVCTEVPVQVLIKDGNKRVLESKALKVGEQVVTSDLHLVPLNEPIAQDHFAEIPTAQIK
ncbi:MAG: efflux RND transporter periplasmic adaptor subunit [Planctomycetales bacterium]